MIDSHLDIRIYNFPFFVCDWTNLYFFLQDIANVLGYDTTTNSNYWKDRVNLELSVAVLDSYKSATVAIVDHHSLVRINQNNM